MQAIGGPVGASGGQWGASGYQKQPATSRQQTADRCYWAPQGLDTFFAFSALDHLLGQLQLHAPDAHDTHAHTNTRTHAHTRAELATM